MTPEKLLSDATQAISDGTRLTLVLPSPWKGRPKGFPKGELLCEQVGSNVYSFCPHKITKWLLSNT